MPSNSSLPHGFVEYKKREYCNSVNCQIQIKLNSTKDVLEYEEIRQNCSGACVNSASDFCSWLAKMGFVIIDSDSKIVDAAKLEEIMKSENTAWKFHHKITQLGMVVARKMLYSEPNK